MLLIDALESLEGDIGLVSARIREGNPLLEKDGLLAEAGLLELLAQSYAAVQGYADSLAEGPVRQGFLVGVRKMEFLARPRVGDALCIQVGAQARLEGFAVVEGQVRRGDEVLARGKIKLWIVPQEGFAN
ncbi:hypothetical protein [Geoalkalibacter halelectricus]|nr:hypothetical protein [Geoalkalibacter halelectricus]MDO3379812.1 hypothetical protein [Geoalkalibacter halelectricus]